MLKHDWKIDTAVWSVTSYTELHCDGAASERITRLSDDEDSAPFVARALAGTRYL